ncbi:proton-associated sugar transporter A [Zootermopsis nevadensis]|uniref:Membrane-associated transporter protein n=1 Tax=Zootermopsis nevadensis TaxID=136037 RepID=A0A067RHI5_ZOONE|nr:proton-associated sugar transporter A [Zootermopsis nevadensis]XP_021913517.1 proton-associated sugar transporter A [Zootermopsis nevadensis]XP_021913518.1 proton-associated sugar transporter A [Zootermopsis nevadensis]KDR22503.1 Membrane-associated transporter protein [Zootermopsis nevadensis]
MVEKLHTYQGVLGRLHAWRDAVRAQWCAVKEEHCHECKDGSGILVRLFGKKPPTNETQQDSPLRGETADYSHAFRRKTRCELVRISAAVMGVEFSYAAETAFVSPILLKIGVQHEHMTLVWALSPIVGFFVTPLLGSISDRCNLRFGRRRPFILILALGILTGLLLVPNGEAIGRALGDTYPSRTPSVNSTLEPDANDSHPWSVIFTVLGTVLLDFDADACQSPSRSYLLDITVPEDHARGLSTFTVMAGLGGCMGYALGAVNWDVTAFGEMLGGHVRAVFTLITVIFVVCVAVTVSSFREIPLELHDQVSNPKEKASDKGILEGGEVGSYGTVVRTSRRECQDPYHPIDGLDTAGNGYVNYGYDESYHQEMRIEETSFIRPNTKEVASGCAVDKTSASLLQYLLSIVYMPSSLRILCVTNLFSWSAHVCYSLYFTDFVAEAVFKGDPKAADGTLERELFEEGVRFGCWGMSMYSLSCAFYSLIIERLIKKFRARNVYISGLLLDSVGMLMLAVTRHRYAVIVFSASAGVMYSTLFTMPYLLVAHYHASGTFKITKDGEAVRDAQLRGLGTDVAIVSSMVFLAQFILSMCMGSIVSLFGTTTTVVGVAAILSFFGAIAASQVMYLEL